MREAVCGVEGGCETKLHLGCGNRHLTDWVNVDRLPPCDMVVDLAARPWPWQDASVDRILMCHALEHLPDLVGSVCELHRILRPGGIVTITVPHYRNPRAHAVGHERFFSLVTFDQIERGVSYVFGKPMFHRESLRLAFPRFRWWASVANLAPFLYELLGLPTVDIVWEARRMDSDAVGGPCPQVPAGVPAELTGRCDSASLSPAG